MEAGSIAVVIPTFDRLELLRETLRSVEGQERPATRIVVVDDGSSDGSAEWAESETSATVLRNPEGGWGPARARAEGSRLADAEMIAFLDSDDLLLPNALADLSFALERSWENCARQFIGHLAGLQPARAPRRTPVLAGVRG